jgi:hypothetical protein
MRKIINPTGRSSYTFDAEYLYLFENVLFSIFANESNHFKGIEVKYSNQRGR